MPRPGPRPYECVRRAWHSDRHQPMRGSLIQEIFRVVNEIHSSATKKNKEWQDKLPLVVLKAEEIMYSKANTEAEYMDLKTLWERTNDAVNTIIRRDESSESGDLLQPCIEAALNLGCTPRKASRSQRNNSPRCYLSPTTQEATQTAVVSKKLDTLAYDGSSQMLTPNSGVTVLNPGPQFPAGYSNPVIHVNVASTHLSSDSCSSTHHDKPMPLEKMNVLPMSSFEFLTMPGNFALPWQNKSPHQFDPSHSSGAINPSYYSNNPSMAKSGFAYQYPQGANHAEIIVSMPTIKEAKTDFLQNLLNSDIALDALDKVASGSLNFEGSLENLSDMGCDLSLRLGPLPTHWNHENNSTQDASSSSHGKNRFCDPSRIRTGLCDCSSASSCRVRGFCFVSSESSSTPWSAAQINGVPRGRF